MPRHTSYTNENFPGSAQTQVTGLNDNGVTVGFYSNTNLGPPNDNNIGFFEQKGSFTAVVNPSTPAGGVPINQLLGVNTLTSRSAFIMTPRATATVIL